MVTEYVVSGLFLVALASILSLRGRVASFQETFIAFTCGDLTKISSTRARNRTFSSFDHPKVLVTHTDQEVQGMCCESICLELKGSSGSFVIYFCNGEVTQLLGAGERTLQITKHRRTQIMRIHKEVLRAI